MIWIITYIQKRFDGHKFCKVLRNLCIAKIVNKLEKDESNTKLCFLVFICEISYFICKHHKQTDSVGNELRISQQVLLETNGNS